MDLLQSNKPKNHTCPRCNKRATHLVKTYWGGKFGKLCTACCLKAVKNFELNGWPPVPWENKEVPEDNRSASEIWRDAVGLDAEGAQEAKAEAMDRVADATDPSWKEQALATVMRVAESVPEFTSDDIWAAGLPKPAEARELGPIMMTAARRKWCKKADKTTPTTQVSRHGTDIAVWKSLIYGRT